MTRILALLATLVLALPAFAKPSQNPIRIFSDGCTDSFDTPAPLDTRDLTDTTTWDSPSESIDLLSIQRKWKVQTTGSADGWCDADGSIRSDVATSQAVQQVVFGPFPIAHGYALEFDYDTIGTNYSHSLVRPRDGQVAESPGFFNATASFVSSGTTLSSGFHAVGWIANSTDWPSYVDDYANFGAAVYVQVLWIGAAAWDLDMVLWFSGGPDNVRSSYK